MADTPERAVYVPTFEVSSDDLVITDPDGNEYHPHAGEWVRFRQDLPWRLTQISVDMPNDEYCRAVIAVLVRQIRDWTWTAEDGTRLPKPGQEGFEAALWDLAPHERNWLRDNCWQRSVPNG